MKRSTIDMIRRMFNREETERRHMRALACRDSSNMEVQIGEHVENAEMSVNTMVLHREDFENHIKEYTHE